MRKETRSLVHALGLSLFGLGSLAGPLLAPPAGASAVQGVLANAPPDSFLILLPSRAAELVRQELETAEAATSAANADLVSAQGLLGEAKAQVGVRKGEVETVKAKIKLAKEQKNQTEQENLEQEAKTKEFQVKVLDARAELREAEVRLAEARRGSSQTLSAFLKKEMELLGKRDDLSKMTAPSGGTKNLDGLVRLQTETSDLERRCLEILGDVAERAKKEAEAESILLGRRLKLLEGQVALLGGARK